MNDQDREMLRQLLSSAGSVASQGFDYAVRYTLVDGVTSILWGLAALGIAIWGFKKLTDWKPPTDFDSEPARAVKGVAKTVCVVGMIVFSSVITSGITHLIAPQGATINRLLGR